MSVAGGRGLGSQYYSLRWNNHPVNLVTVFTGLYQVSQQPALQLQTAPCSCSSQKILIFKNMYIILTVLLCNFQNAITLT